MSINVGINGFGRMGRLLFRVLQQYPQLKVKVINDPSGSADTFSHLLNFDSVHGPWKHKSFTKNEAFIVENQSSQFFHNLNLTDSPWDECDLVIDCTGKFKSKSALQPYLDMGVKHVLVTAPVKEDGVLNIVKGVNCHLFDKDKHPIVTAASCTTNCLAPVVKVVHENLGIKHGSMTTIHSLTNTQTIIDSAHKDLRRARSCGSSLIPTTTGSATAITHIFPELKGKLNGHAVRVPLANASLTDCVFEVETTTDIDSVNRLFEKASTSELSGILGYETLPLVSIDYKTDPRSVIVDALSTMVVNGTHVKLYLWYDNEWGYINRTAEIALMISR